MSPDELIKRYAELGGDLRGLKEEARESGARSSKIAANMRKIAEESSRVADLAHDAPQVLGELDEAFEQKTRLDRRDVSFLFLAAALQCIRWYVLSNDKFRLTSGEGDALVGRVIPKRWHDILLAPVPYDAYGPKELHTGLGGSTHRYRTLGHDPIMGWVFGPMNILSDSLTKYNIFESYAVRNHKIAGPMPTPEVFVNGWAQIKADKYNLPVAVARQALHFGSDYFTKQGLPLPLISTADNDLAKKMVTECNIDMLSVARSAGAAILINALVSCVHQLFYAPGIHGSRKLYEVKTRKILQYSNLIASGSNVLYVAVTRDLKKLDIGGFLVTLYRLVSDTKFIGQIKREFIMESFNERIRGEAYDFDECAPF